MEYVLVTLLALTLAGSFLCSLSESALYSIPLSYVKLLEESGSRSGRILAHFKEDMSSPISAILILNTVANTAGPALCGALADDLWGDSGVIWMAAFLTVGILFVGEITPKILGVTYARAIAPVVALPISVIEKIFHPILWVSKGISTAVRPTEESPSVSHEEVKSMAEIGTEEGSLDEFEGEVIQNVIELDERIVRDILTPRVVVFRLREDLTVGEVEKELPEWSHSRVPVYQEADPDHLMSYVLQRDVFREAVRGNRSQPLKNLSRPLPVVPELMPADKLLLRMIDRREHICAVVDEHGGLAGIVTLEDVIEELVGREIVDEYDAVADLRTFAGLLRVVRHRKHTGQDSSPAGVSAGNTGLDRALREARRLKGKLPPETSA